MQRLFRSNIQWQNVLIFYKFSHSRRSDGEDKKFRELILQLEGSSLQVHRSVGIGCARSKCSDFHYNRRTKYQELVFLAENATTIDSLASVVPQVMSNPTEYNIYNHVSQKFENHSKII